MRRDEVQKKITGDFEADLSVNIQMLVKELKDKTYVPLPVKRVEISNGNEIEEIWLGSPQGGVISPLLANIYLNEFDHFMKERNYRIVRYVDDILILCISERSAKHVLEVATTYFEKTLKLTVNQEKAHITNCKKGVKFLGVEILC